MVEFIIIPPLFFNYIRKRGCRPSKVRCSTSSLSLKNLFLFTGNVYVLVGEGDTAKGRTPDVWGEKAVPGIRKLHKA